MNEHNEGYKATIEELFAQIVQTDGASDLILTTDRQPSVRIYGEVHPMVGYPLLRGEDTESLCMSLLNEEQIKEFRSNKEIDLSVHIEDVGRFRMNIFRQKGNMAMVARRVLDHIPDFEWLGLPQVITELVKLKKGLILFTGPTGHGKSTSVASVIDYINSHRNCHIISIEDPIEFLHRHNKAVVEQREVGLDTDSFALSLRRVLRQAPDVIVIGEIRDRESAQAALTLAETGHLIISTLHTSGAIASVSRLIDMFPPEQERQIRLQLSVSLAAVIWQQLIPAAEKENGLTLACEVLVTIPAIRSLIRQGRIHEIHSHIQTGRKYGMFTMDQSLAELMDKGKVDPEWFKNNYFEMKTNSKTA